MPASKIVDVGEVLGWFEEGRTYDWMTRQYREKYNIECSPSMWGNFRRRRGLDPRIIHDEQLSPWSVEEKHRMAHPIQMLRMEARLRAGESIRAEDVPRVRNFVARLQNEKLVVHYDPKSPEGFQLVPREEGDWELTRPPNRQLASSRGGSR